MNTKQISIKVEGQEIVYRQSEGITYLDEPLAKEVYRTYMHDLRVLKENSEGNILKSDITKLVAAYVVMGCSELNGLAYVDMSLTEKARN